MVRTLAVLKLKKRISDILVFARHVAASMKNNPDFPHAPRALEALPGHIEAATRAQTAALSQPKGSAAKVKLEVGRVKLDLEHLRVFVQGMAGAMQPAEAARIIVSAGLFVKGRIARKRQGLAARAGKTSGSVHLTTKFAEKDTLYAWAYSLDQRTWTELALTQKAKTTVKSLVPGTTYFFRARALRRTGAEDWTAPIAFLVA